MLSTLASATPCSGCQASIRFRVDAELLSQLFASLFGADFAGFKGPAPFFATGGMQVVATKMTNAQMVNLCGHLGCYVSQPHWSSRQLLRSASLVI